jgi:hypothetical protein
MGKSVDQVTKEWLDQRLLEIETASASDVIYMQGPLEYGHDLRVRNAIEPIEPKAARLLVILETNGGSVEICERIATVFRHHYSEVAFLVPDRAMSAGTVLVMSGDEIFMDYFSLLGPIDPQIFKDGRWVPALSYLEQHDRLQKKAASGDLTTADLHLLSKLDLAELHAIELARDQSVALIEKWLPAYKFKEWKLTETSKTPVTDDMRRTRAKEIAQALNDQKQWFSHSRGITMETLTADLRLKISDYSADKLLKDSVGDYFTLMREFTIRQGLGSFIHTKKFF